MLKRDRRKPKLKDAQDERIMGENDKISRHPEGAKDRAKFLPEFLLNAKHFY